MVDDKQLQQVMATVLEVAPESVGPDTNMDTVAGWDSLRHMTLVLTLEDEFGVQIRDEDAGGITSYPLIKLVLDDLLRAKA